MLTFYRSVLGCGVCGLYVGEDVLAKSNLYIYFYK